MQTVYREWRGELVVWLLPNIREVRRFDVRGIPTLAVPSRLLDRISVVHVGENGQVVHPDLPVANRTPADDLLRAWLTSEEPIVDHLGPEWSAVTQVPVFEGDDVYLQEITLAMSQRSTNIGAQKFRAAIIQGGFRLFLTQIEQAAEDGRAPAYPDYQAEAAKVPVSGFELPFRLVWPDPFHEMLPVYSNVEDLEAFRAARRIAQLAEADPAQARSALPAESLNWVSIGVSTVQRTWFEPLMAKHGAQDALIAAEEKLKLPAAMSLSDAASKPEWRYALERPSAVTRVWVACPLKSGPP